MTERSLAHFKRTICVNKNLLEEISELTGLEYRVLSSAFAGEEKDLTFDVVKMVIVKYPQGNPERWQNHVLEWAKEK